MSTTIYPTVKAAHTAALAGIKAALGRQGVPVKGTLANFALKQYTTSEWVTRFPENNAAKTLPHVQVGAHFLYTKPAGTTTLHIMLDADIPPKDGSIPPGAQPDPRRDPHIGWEMKVDNKRVANDHCFVKEGVLKNGRPKKGDEDKWAKVAAPTVTEVPGKNEKLVFQPAYWRLVK